ENSPPILIVHGGKDQQVGIHHAYYLADQLELKGATHETFYQMAEGHVPRPPAMVETLTYIKEFMNQVESHS
ncbi:TPA: prolyl oligopeptidase family serine peptidase, partial [Staphylococcus aureus]|nr:prolyl oligopeptidase family serine peptidase [Staphylococcus aureus]